MKALKGISIACMFSGIILCFGAVGDILVLEDKLNPYFNLAVALENIKKTGVLK